ncbi:carbohydrate porin [Endozoicomonas ascidiicola]|uniref:carbohydrate porin n=1 Tax=Endozoicomonas ascidiicola TaxID=1698521 RepID=UPI000829AC86|nr:carbohydrate porin [Endozoicomonas ascidiicola]
MKNITFKTLALATAIAGITSQVQADYDISFNGYGRMGAGYSSDDPVQGEKKNGINVIKAPESQYPAPGRLGNEKYGFEVGVNNKFTSDNGQVLDVYFMLEDWSQNQDEQGFPQAFVRASNVFDSQPGASVWAGKRHLGRTYMWQNDYFYLLNDGTGAGIENLNMGGALLDSALVAGGTGNNNRYGFINKIHGIQLSDSVDMAINLNYGFAADDDESTESKWVVTEATKELSPDQYLYEKETTTTKPENGHQLAFNIGQNWSMGRNELHVRSSRGFRHGMMWGNADKDLKSLMFGLRGNIDFSSKFGVHYNFLHETNKDMTDDGAAIADETLTQLVVTPVYKHSDIHSTRLEVGIDSLKFDDLSTTKGDTNKAWRVGLEHAIQLNSFGWPSPTLKFFVNHGEVTEAYELTKSDKRDATTIGAMMEASW